jgi:hypothetical protein
MELLTKKPSQSKMTRMKMERAMMLKRKRVLRRLQPREARLPVRRRRREVWCRRRMIWRRLRIWRIRFLG